MKKRSSFTYLSLLDGEKMLIENTSKMSPIDAQKIEKEEKTNAVNASVIKLRVGNDGKVTTHEIVRMIAAARQSKAYQQNYENFQFKLKSDGQGQYLTLKQQGAWSNFKGIFGWGHTAREKERANAKDLINKTIGSHDMPEMNYKDKGILTNQEAKVYQQSLMNRFGIDPSVKPSSQVTEPENNKKLSYSDLVSSISDRVISEEEVENHKSYVSVYDEPAKKASVPIEQTNNDKKDRTSYDARQTEELHQSFNQNNSQEIQFDDQDGRAPHDSFMSAFANAEQLKLYNHKSDNSND
jgi:hypothetical protein